MNYLIRSVLLLSIIIMANSIESQAGPAESRCSDVNTITVEDWRTWAQVTSKPVRSEGHSNNWVGIFVDERAKDTYLNAGARYPVCARVVKAIYENADGTSVRKLTVMIKMTPGYDPGNGDWWYASFDEAGKQVWQQGRLPGCILCHRQAAETDYLFSKDVLEALKK